jgi:hypothetical protein
VYAGMEPGRGCRGAWCVLPWRGSEARGDGTGGLTGCGMFLHGGSSPSLALSAVIRRLELAARRVGPLRGPTPRPQQKMHRQWVYHVMVLFVGRLVGSFAAPLLARRAVPAAPGRPSPALQRPGPRCHEATQDPAVLHKRAFAGELFPRGRSSDRRSHRARVSAQCLTLAKRHRGLATAAALSLAPASAPAGRSRPRFPR